MTLTIDLDLDSSKMNQLQFVKHRGQRLLRSSYCPDHPQTRHTHKADRPLYRPTKVVSKKKIVDLGPDLQKKS